MAESSGGHKADALLVFGKEPVAGRVKTRLQPPLTGHEAAELYRAFLEDSLALYAAVDADRWLFIKASELDPWSQRYPGFHIRRQKGSTLGDRMRNAFDELFRAGYRRVVIIGTDHPTLPLSYISAAFGELHYPSSMVIGPAYDGGYYLLGMNEFQPGLFAQMTYSHDGVFDETIRRAAVERLSVTVLPFWYDIDDLDGLQRLYRDVMKEPSVWPRISGILRRLVYQHPELLPRDQAE